MTSHQNGNLPAAASTSKDCDVTTHNKSAGSSNEKFPKQEKKISFAPDVKSTEKKVKSAENTSPDRKRRHKEKKSRFITSRYRKPAVAISLGVFSFLAGVVMAALYFAGVLTGKGVEASGPVLLSLGLLVGVCGLVWVSIVKKKKYRHGYL